MIDRTALTSAEVAAELGLSERTLYTWRRIKPTPGPPFVQIRRVIRYPVGAFLAWVADRQPGKLAALECQLERATLQLRRLRSPAPRDSVSASRASNGGRSGPKPPPSPDARPSPLRRLLADHEMFPRNAPPAAIVPMPAAAMSD